MSIRGWLLALTLAYLAGCAGGAASTAATSDPKGTVNSDPPPASTPAPGTGSALGAAPPAPRSARPQAESRAPVSGPRGGSSLTSRSLSRYGTFRTPRS